MAIKNKEGHWIDAAGNAIPVKYIKKYDKTLDKVVTGLAEKARRTSAAIASLKKQAFDDIEKFISDAEKIYGMTVRTAEGNKVLTNFSNTIKIEIKVNKIIDFDNRLQMAKGIIDVCLKTWGEGSDDKIKLIVDRAFAVDNKGKLDRDRILDLRNIDIKEPEWKQAMHLINESIRIVGTRTYIRFWEKKGNDWEVIPLDIAGC